MSLANNKSSSWVIATLIFIIGCSTTFFIVERLRNDHQNFTQLKFDKNAEAYASTLQTRLDSNIELIYYLKSFYLNNDKMSFDKFSQFSKSLVTPRTGVQSLEWIPKLAFDEKEIYESKMRSQGFSSFSIFEIDENENQTPVRKRPWYYPAYYVYPYEENKNIHGLDLASHPKISAAMEFSAETGKLQISDVLESVRQTEDFVFFAFMPVYGQSDLVTNFQRKESLVGFLLGVYHISTMISPQLLSPEFPFDIYLFDASEHNYYAPILMTKHAELGDIKYSELPAKISDIEVLKTDIHLPGRLWKLVIAPKDKYLESFYSDVSLSLLIAGLLLSGLLAACLLLIIASLRQLGKIRKINESLDKRNSQLKEAYHDMEGFSYSVSHDLRAPLRHMHGFVQLLLRNSDGLTDKQLRFINVISESAHKMGTLIDDLLHFSRTSRAELKLLKVNLNEIIEQIIAELTLPDDNKQIQWVIEPIPLVIADPNLIKIVFTNLISNAIKYSHPKSTPKIEIGFNQYEKDKIVIYIKDNGVGFDMKFSDKLFGVFQRLHAQEEFDGTGIGLATTKKILQRHGERVWAQADLGEGAEFYLTLKTWSSDQHETTKNHTTGRR